jgi:hypothetical protein
VIHPIRSYYAVCGKLDKTDEDSFYQLSALSQDSSLSAWLFLPTTRSTRSSGNNHLYIGYRAPGYPGICRKGSALRVDAGCLVRAPSDRVGPLESLEPNVLFTG